MDGGRRRWLLVGATCIVLAVIHTWPLASAPAEWSRNDNGDAQLNEWILAWVAHQLPRDPSRLFDANIFYPSRQTLAYSEPLIVPGLLGAPLRWLGASPVLTFNVVLILGFALTACAGYALVHAWTGSSAGGLLAGSVLAFNTHTLTRLPHVQGVHIWGLPLALLSADRLIMGGRTRDAVWLSLWMSALACTSGYLMVFGTVMIGVAFLSRARDWWNRRTAVLARLALAAVLTGVAVWPVYAPYRRLAADEGLVRSLEEAGSYSATLTGYLASAGRLHYWLWSERLFATPIDPLFPGFVVLLLSICAAWPARPGRVPGGSTARGADASVTRRRAWMLVAIAAVGFVLSLGTHTPVYGWLFKVLPPLRGLRAVARFGKLCLLGLAALAGMGLARLTAGWQPRRALVAGAVAVLLVNGEALRAPLRFTRFEGIPAIYSLLRDEPGQVVLVEVPFYSPRAVFRNAGYVLNSTAHFRPIMNGYSGYLPKSYEAFAAEFAAFPEPSALRAMRRAGATHVMVHPAGFDLDAAQTEAMMERVSTSPGLERVAVGRRGIALYRLR